MARNKKYAYKYICTYIHIYMCVITSVTFNKLKLNFAEVQTHNCEVFSEVRTHYTSKFVKQRRSIYLSIYLSNIVL